MGTKRKRLALSCVDCRRRKVKCDRTYPICERCQKGGNADNCLYVSHTGLEPNNILTPSEDSPQQQQQHVPSQVVPSGEPYVLAALREMSPHMEVQSRQPPAPPSPTQAQPSPGLMRSLFGRASQLETYTRTAGSKPVSSTLFSDQPVPPTSKNDGMPDASTEFGKVMVRGKDFSTHYYGPSFAISMLLQFEELSKFVKGMLNDTPSLAAIKEKMTNTRAGQKKTKHKQSYTRETNLHAMIPERAIADKLVEQYLSTFETTYRILHVPTFRRQYEAYWRDPVAAKVEFMMLLLMVMATVYTIVPGGPHGFVGRSSARREVASRWITICESWLEEQSHKHIILAHFQAHILVFLAKAVNCIKIKREWTSSGQLLRFAMAVGMHREPSLLSRRIDVFDQEMRRRLWFTIVELDLITTIARGMPPTVDSFSWDCHTPRNIDDEDFDETTEHLPPSKPRTTFTRTSFLHIATESLPIRIEILSRINSIRLALDLEAVMQYDHKLRTIIDALPTWKTPSLPSSLFAQTLLMLIPYELILILHVPFTTQTQHRSRTFYSTASKREISFKTLQIYATLPDTERLLFIDLREDACRATLALTHDMITNMHRDILPETSTTLSYLDTITSTMATRFGTLGQGFHTFWISLSAYNLLLFKTSSTHPAGYFTQQAADRVGEIFSLILTQQVAMPLENGEVPPSLDGSVYGTSRTNGTVTTDEVDGGVDFDSGGVGGVGVGVGGGGLEGYDGGAFHGFEQLNFFDDPFSDVNFDLAGMWSLGGGDGGLMG